MTQPMFFPIIILIGVFSFFIYGKFRTDIIALAALLLLGIFGLAAPEELLSGFANPITLMFAGLYIVGAGIFNTGLIEKTINPLIKWSGGSEKRLIAAIMLVAGLFGGLVRSTGIVAILLPIVMSTALKQRRGPARFLIPLAFASSIGGLLTLAGRPSNLLVSQVLEDSGYKPLSFFSLTPLGLIGLAAGVAVMLILGGKLLPRRLPSRKNIKGVSAGELAGMYKIYDRLHYISVPNHSDLVGERLSDLLLPVHYEITVIEITRKSKEKPLGILSKNQSLSANANEIIHPDDCMLVFGDTEAVRELAADYELEIRPFDENEAKQHFAGNQFGLTEILIIPHSEYENQTLRDIHFREKYQCSVLAIKRKGEYIQADVGKEQLRTGDALLIHGEWNNIERISADLQDIIVIGSAAEENPLPEQEAKAPIAAAITILMMVLLAFEWMPAPLAVLLPAFLMVLTGCVRSMEEAYQRINWETIILISCMFPLVSALEKTDALLLGSSLLERFLGEMGPYGLMAGIFVIMLVCSHFVSSLAAAMILAPVVLTAATDLSWSPEPFLVLLTAAANIAFSTPKASPMNSLVMTAGEYKYKHFANAGILLQVLLGILFIWLIPYFYPF